MIKGRLMKNRDVLSVPTGSWTNAKNVLYHRGFKTIKNENGASYKLGVPHGYSIIGRIDTPTDIVLFSTDNNHSQITLFRNNIQTTIIHDSQHLLNFNLRNAIEGVYRYDNSGNLIISWSDGVDDASNTPYILNVDSLPFSLTGTYEFVNTTDINKMRLFPDAIYPTMDASVLYGGRCKQGVYWFTMKYIIDEFNTINTVGLSNKSVLWEATNEHITPASGGTTFDLGTTYYQNSDYSSIIGNSIRIAFSNLDTRFRYFELYAIHFNNGELKTYKVAKLPTSATYYDFLGDLIDEVDSANLLIPTMRVDKVETMTVCDNKLCLGNVIDNYNYNYQKFANNIKVSHNLIGGPTVPVSPYSITINSLMPFEVYALYIHLIWKNGSISSGFHIPGRAAELMDIAGRGAFPNICSTHTLGLLGTSSSYDEREAVQCLIDDTNAHISELGHGSKVFQTRDTSSISGKLGYWENANEVYVDNDNSDIYTVSALGVPSYVSTLRGTPVRHHRMPSAGVLSANDTNDPADRRITLTFSDIPIPADLLPLIQGVCFSYAERKDENKMIYGEVTPIKHHQEDVGAATTLRLTNAMELMSSHEHLDNITLIKFQEIEYSVTSSPFPDTTGTFYRFDRVSYLHAYGYTNAENAAFGPYKLFASSDFKYIPYNVTTVNPWEDNKNRESTLFLNVFGTAGVNQCFDGGTTQFDTYLIVKKQTNMYIDYYNQSIVMCPEVSYITTTGLQTHNITNSFDAYINKTVQCYSYKTALGAYIASSFNYYSFDNIATSQRQKPATLTFTSFLDTYATSKTTDVNPFTLDGIYASPFDFYLTKGSDVMGIGVTNVLRTYNTKRPYMLMRSQSATSEGLYENWRTFLINNYYEFTFNKGDIVKLESAGKTLYIQYRYSLFIASIKDVLQANNVNAYLAEGDIFDRDPQEVYSTENGTIGCHSKFECKYTDIGLVVVDRKANSVWLVNNNSASDIAKFDMKDYFDIRMNQFITDTIPNPYIYNGIHIEYDRETERLLLTKLGWEIDTNKYTYGGENPDGTNPYVIFYEDGNFVYFDPKLKFIPISTDMYIDRSFTLSYVNGIGWISMHDYKPNAYCSTKTGFYGIQNVTTNRYGRLYLHNISTNKGQFYDSGGYLKYRPSYIDYVINQNKATRWASVEWKADVIGLGSSSTTKTFNQTFTHIQVYNDRQCSRLIDLKNNYLRNTRNIVETWKFNNFRDDVMNKTLPFIDIDGNTIATNLCNDTTLRKNFFEKSKFFSNFVAIRLQYDNVVQKEIILNEVTINAMTV